MFNSTRNHPDRLLLISITLLVITGFIIFLSASLGLLARESANFSAIIIKQLFFGLGLGLVALFLTMHIPYRTYRKYAFYIFLLTFLLTLLVYVPGIGLTLKGATRWIEVGGISFQPSELLKVGFIIYFAAWLSIIKDRKQVFSLGIIPYCLLLLFLGATLLLQPDTDGFLIIALTGGCLLFLSGLNFKQIGVLFCLGLIAAGALFYTRPYLKERLLTFYKPETADTQGAGYQINQSLIAIGSGGLTGKGFGQSVQKFEYLPEPIGDSIFAVAGEEFGFIGTTLLIILFVIFTLRGIKVAVRSKDNFGQLLGIGLVLLIVIQSFINIASMVGLFPLSGTPLIFVSQGGSSLMMALAEVGILLNISKQQSV